MDSKYIGAERPSWMMDGDDTRLIYIRERVPEKDRLTQLAEEATELAKAALKMARACDANNPTPVSYGEARRSLTEEFADVLVAVDAVVPDVWGVCSGIYFNKLSRWTGRLLMCRCDGLTDKGRREHR